MFNTVSFFRTSTAFGRNVTGSIGRREITSTSAPEFSKQKLATSVDNILANKENLNPENLRESIKSSAEENNELLKFANTQEERDNLAKIIVERSSIESVVLDTNYLLGANKDFDLTPVEGNLMQVLITVSQIKTSK